jgi:hypothetical protein
VTPFSGQTLDRALVATLLTMVRHHIDAMQPPLGVMELHDNRPAAEQVLQWLICRARGHRDWYDDTAESRIADLVQRRGRNFFDAWERVIDKARAGAATRVYSKNDGAANLGLPLMYTATDEPPDDNDARQFEAPTSMRDVEPSVHVWLRFAPLDSRK